MKNAIITGIIAATIVMADSPSSVAQAQERAIVTQAKSIVLPEFNLEGVTLPEALKQLNTAAKESDPSNRINFLLTQPATAMASPKITLALKKVSVAETAERIAKAAGVFVTPEDFAFVFRPKTNLGAVELVVGKAAQFDLGAGKRCRIISSQLFPDAIHLKVELLSPGSTGKDIVQSLREITTPLDKQCDIRLGEDTMVSLTPTSK